METNTVDTNTVETKVCTRCGKEKPIDDFYQVKYKGTTPKYRYSVCTTCTAIEQKRRYLMQTDPTNPLLAKIEALYDKHRAEGRSVPDAPRRRSTQLEADIDSMLSED